MPMFGELLVVQIGPNGLAPLSSQQSAGFGQIISNVLLKYQWPMCSMSDLTDQEKDELLALGKPSAEEQFIQKKLQESCDSVQLNPGVLYISTALYELFCIHYFLKNNDSILRKVVKKWLFFDRGHRGQAVNLEPILCKDSDAASMRKEICDAYDQVNVRFVQQQNNAWMEINQAFVRFLVENCPELTHCCNALQASKIIEEKSLQLLDNLVQGVVNLKDEFGFFVQPMDYKNNERMHDTVMSLAVESNYAMVKKFIEFEYEARRLNKTLLVRGTSCVKNKLPDDMKSLLIGDTLLHDRCKKNDYWDKDCDPLTLPEAYQDGRIIPYSISFGASLFAGFVKDSTACAYRFLTGHRTYRENFEFVGSVAGYALFVDKKDYDKDRNNKLLFIPPLMTLASLMSNGEYFHPRVTAATLEKDGKPVSISGIFGGDLIDPLEIVLIQRDPLEHAALFSDFVAKNGRIIQRGNDKDLSEEDRKFAAQVLANQTKTAELYQQMQRLFQGTRKPI